MNGIYYSRGLDAEKRTEIAELDRACGRAEPLCMKLNWDMLETRPGDQVNDILWYNGNRLVGFIGMYGFGEKPEEIEVTGMVHPEYRRRGIFRDLYAAAEHESRSRGADRLLLIAERRSRSGVEFAQCAGLPYAFSEFRMICRSYQSPTVADTGLALRPAEEADRHLLQQIDAACFGRSYSDDYERSIDTVFVAQCGGAAVGKIGLNIDGGQGYVYGVAVLPEYRRRGYGRAMLDAVLRRHFADSRSPVILEVAVKNDQALSLYQSCGFEELTTYEYFEKKL